MTLPKGGYKITFQEARLVVKEEGKEHFVELTTKIGKQLLSVRLPVISVKWRKAKKEEGGDERNWSWYDRSHKEHKETIKPRKKGEKAWQHLM